MIIFYTALWVDKMSLQQFHFIVQLKHVKFSPPRSKIAPLKFYFVLFGVNNIRYVM